MTEFIINITLFTAVFVLLIVWAVAAARRRRRERAAQRQDRRLLLAALTGPAAPADDPDDVGGPDDEDAEVLVRNRPATRRAGVDRRSRTGLQELDEASLEALLAVLEDGRRPRRGLVGGLFTSPKIVWGAGARAGHSAAQRFAEQTDATEQAGEVSGELFRDAADELLDIHAHDLVDARQQYTHYAVALGSPQLARLYVRSAAHAAYNDPAEVAAVVDQITGAVNVGREELPDGDASDT